MKFHTLFFIALFFPLYVFGQTNELEKNFRNPPSEYTLLPFWSWNGTLIPEKITWQIDQMLEKGVKGAFLHARAGLDESETPYFSEGYWKAFDAAIAHSAEKGFLACLYDEDKWPSGSAGGRTVAANPEEFVKKVLFYNKMEVVGPQTIRLNLHKNPMSVYAGRITGQGTYDYSSQVDLTDKANAQWDVPEGRWAIISFAMEKDPHEQIDYLDSAAVAKFIEITHEEYYRRYGKYFGNTIPGIFFDEIYANNSKMGDNIFWTDDFLKQFRKIKGYDLDECLPLIVLKDPSKSAKVRYDYFDVVKDLYTKAWFRQYADWCETHHIWATGHTTERVLHYKRQADYFSTMGALQVPGADNEEFRYGHPRMVDWYNIKQISSIGNIFDRKRVMVESLGGGGYGIPLDEYRYGLSMLGVYGANMLVPHLFHYTADTPESQADWPPSWFFQNPYWKYFNPLADLGSRISFMIAQGEEVCDVAILYPLTDLWEGGYPDHIDDTFYKDLQRLLLEEHINYNVMDPESFVKAEVTGGAIRIGRGKYKILILPALKCIRTDVARQLETFVENGGAVISLKTLPDLSETGPENDPLIVEKMKDIFGFLPQALRSDGYHQWNREGTNRYTTLIHPNNGIAFFSRTLNQLPQIIHSRITPDLVVKTGNRGHFQFHHRKIENREVFFFVNDKNQSENYHISIRNAGIPSVWNPVTGEVTPLDNYRMVDGRMEMMLSFSPRESYFLVLDEGDPGNRDGLVITDNFDQTRILKSDQTIKVEGWSRPGNGSVSLLAGDKKTVKNVSNDMAEIIMDGNFRFQLAPHALDDKWSQSLEADTLELPVMLFRAERTSGQGKKYNWSAANYDDSQWNQVKIYDTFNKKPGVQRYLSGWDATWICFYDHTTHLPQLAAGNHTFKKNFVCSGKVKDAVIAITADNSYELMINGKTVGSDRDWKTVEVYHISEYLQQGDNMFEIKTTDTRGLLFQGEIRLKNGAIIPVKSDTSWMATNGKTGWFNALNFATPNMGPWKEIENPLQKPAYPVTVWYREELPAGITAVCKPEIKGKYTLYVNGTPVAINTSDQTIHIKNLMKTSNNRIAISIIADDPTCGIQKPLKMICGKTEQPLVSWDKMGLKWYSGRALYTKKADIPAGYLQTGKRLILDLGKVNYFAEVWVNGKLIRFFPWGPFETDITEAVHPGENEITIVVANMLINRANWNILDDNLDNKDARWWHDGSIRREKEKMESGLFGPVKIIPCVKETVEWTHNPN